MQLGFRAGLGAAVFFTAATAFAQSPPAAAPDAVAAAPGGIPVGPLMVYPGIDLAFGHDDNLFLRPTDVRSSNFTIVTPYVRAEAKTGPHRFDVGFRIDDGRYYSSRADDYFNYALTGNADWVFTGRSGLRLHAEYRHSIDARGSNDRTPSATPDEYDNYGVDGVFRYGAAGARGRIEADAGAYALRYTNNQFFTESADRDTAWLGGRFFWRVGPRTEMLLEARQRGIDYRLAASTQDSTENNYYIGVKWEATAATTGTAKFGHMNKKFDAPGRQDVSDNSWDLGVRWSPLTYSVFDFASSKYTSESTGVGDSIVSKNYTVTWSHAWSSRLRTTALAGFRNDEYVGTGVSRNDDVATFGLRVDYDFRRWLKLGAGYTYTDRDSSDSTVNYKRNLLLFTVGATL